MKDTIGIIGAGIAGLLLARELQAAGARVLVFEKSRGLGGRLATKRVGEAVFDHGAQFFTARSAAMTALAERWRQAGLVAGWPEGDEKRWLGKPSMTALPKALATGLEVLREHKVEAVRRHPQGGWELSLAEQGLQRCERLVFTCPPPQALALLAAGEVVLRPEVQAALAALTYHPCLALLLVLAGPSGVPAAGVNFVHGPIRWLADNVKKGLVQNVPAAVTVHAATEFSALHYATSEAEVLRLLRPALDGWLHSEIVSATLHRWRYSEPQVSHPEPCVWLPEWRLGLAGDAFGGPRVEGAVLSALALAARVRAELVV